MNDIEKPTLFIRYISSEKKEENGISTELKYIEENVDYIYHLLTSFNPNNRILYVGTPDVISNVVKIYHILPDDGRIISTDPFAQNDELYSILCSIKIKGQKDNIRHFQKKNRSNKYILVRSCRKLKEIYEKYFCKVYIHSKVYYISGK